MTPGTLVIHARLRHPPMANVLFAVLGPSVDADGVTRALEVQCIRRWAFEDQPEFIDGPIVAPIADLLPLSTFGMKPIRTSFHCTGYPNWMVHVERDASITTPERHWGMSPFVARFQNESYVEGDRVLAVVLAAFDADEAARAAYRAVQEAAAA